MFFHKFAHINAHERFWIIKHNSASFFESSVFPTPGRPEKQERTNRTIWIANADARALDRIGHFFHRIVLADDFSF